MHYDPRNANCIVFFAIMSTTHNLYAMECTPLIAYPYTNYLPPPAPKMSWSFVLGITTQIYCIYSQIIFYVIVVTFVTTLLMNNLQTLSSQPTFSSFKCQLLKQSLVYPAP